MPDTGRSDRSSANGASPDRETVVRAFDCTDPMHESARFTAETEDVLVEKVLGHFAEYHPEIPRETVLRTLVDESYVETRDDDEALI